MTEISANLAVSVIIPTHNPRRDYLSRVVDALRVQTLPHEEWEVLVVDNGSREPLKAGRRQTAKPRSLVKSKKWLVEQPLAADQ